MSHYIYIIYSKSADVFYKGETANPTQRLSAHNSDSSTYTKSKGPWELLYLEEFPNRTEALIKEKAIKRLNRRSLEKMIKGGANLLLKNPPECRPVTSRHGEI